MHLTLDSLRREKIAGCKSEALSLPEVSGRLCELTELQGHVRPIRDLIFRENQALPVCIL